MFYVKLYVHSLVDKLKYSEVKSKVSFRRVWTRTSLHPSSHATNTHILRSALRHSRQLACSQTRLSITLNRMYKPCQNTEHIFRLSVKFLSSVCPSVVQRQRQSALKIFTAVVRTFRSWSKSDKNKRQVNWKPKRSTTRISPVHWYCTVLNVQVKDMNEFVKENKTAFYCTIKPLLNFHGCRYKQDRQ